MKSPKINESEDDDLLQREMLRLIKAFHEIRSPAIRQRLIDDAESAVRQQAAGMS